MRGWRFDCHMGDAPSVAEAYCGVGRLKRNCAARFHNRRIELATRILAWDSRAGVCGVRPDSVQGQTYPAAVCI
jgi:hypothetical protein